MAQKKHLNAPAIRESRYYFIQTDPETREDFYKLKPIEATTMVLLVVLLYILHTIMIAMITIMVYKQKIQKMETQQKIVYIAGPISYQPNGNYAAFSLATKIVRNMGHIAKNPHEFCSDIPRSAPWGTFIRRGLKQLMECTDIILLPGWESSDGASLEQLNASLVGITVHDSIAAFQHSVSDKTPAPENG